MATKLTEAAISRFPAAPEGKRVERPDILAPGLVLRINDRGRRDWIVRYRLNGRQVKMALGTWPALGLAEARERSREVRTQAAVGVDPKATIRAKAATSIEAARTFADLADAYLARDASRLATASEIVSNVRNRLLPSLGDVRLADLRKRHLVSLTDSLVDAGLPGAALRSHQTAKRITSWALGRDEIDADPFAGLPPPVAKVARDRALSEVEIAILWRAFGERGHPFGDMFRFLMLTATRRNEAAEMTWRELDNPDAPTLWEIPPERAKNRVAQAVPLSAAARAILADLPREDRGPFIFSTTGGARPVSGFSRAKAAVDKVAARLNDGDPLADWRLHDLRRTARTGLARLGVPNEIAERCLGHVGGSQLLRTYNVHQYRAEVADALSQWGAEVERITGERYASTVTPLAVAR